MFTYTFMRKNDAVYASIFDTARIMRMVVNIL